MSRDPRSMPLIEEDSEDSEASEVPLKDTNPPSAQEPASKDSNPYLGRVTKTHHGVHRARIEELQLIVHLT